MLLYIYIFKFTTGNTMRIFTNCTPTLLGVMVLSLFSLSECLQMTVRPDKATSVKVSTSLPADQCTVCTVSGVNDTETSCKSSLSLVPDEDVTLLFNCSQPIDQAYSVEISSSIECTKDSCSPPSAEAQPSFLTEFPRVFTWDLKAPEKTVVGIDILGEGLKKTSEPTPCPDGYQYSVTRPKLTGGVHTQGYCRGGSVTHFDLADKVTLSLQVKPDAPVNVVFSATAAPLKGRKMDVNADPGTTVVLSRISDEMECEVCTTEGSSPTCSPTELTLTDPQKTSLDFSCPHPQDVFSAHIKRKIECTKDSCSPDTGAVQLDLFSEFPRILTWDLTVPDRTVLSLDFPSTGLKEKTASEKCKDGYQYSVISTGSEGQVTTKGYCRDGAGPHHMDLLGKTTVTLEVPQGEDLDPAAFTASAMPRKGRAMSVTPDPNTIVRISREVKDVDCSVCVEREPNQKCHPRELVLRDARNTSVEFTCPQPQDVFSVTINREIDCTEITCNGNIVQAESFLFPDFNRTFTWDLKVPSTRVFQLDFPEPGMRQIPNGESCPDEHTYTIITYQRTGPSTIGTYCRKGSVSTVGVRYKGRVSLDVPGDRKLDPLDFKVTVGPETDMLAIVKVDLPRGVSDTAFTTVNYPKDFPDNEQMMWHFIVPGMHNYTVHFQGHTEPECISKEVRVEYQKEGPKVTKLSLTDGQPEHRQGNFNMSLFNCQTNRSLQGLTLDFSVSLMRSGHPVLCTVDLTQKEGVTVQIEKVGSDPYCEMRMDSAVTEKAVVAPGTKAKLSFLDCPNEDLRLTASCHNLDSCAENRTLLTLPKMASCLPMPLHSFTWHLTVPEDGTVNLQSTTGTLRQSLPGQECNGSFVLEVADGQGSPVGDFCQKGIIRKLQVHSNVTVTAKAQDFSKIRGAFVNVSFSNDLSDSIIYRVTPRMSAPSLLASPNWPSGMKPFSTVSWIITLPSQYRADLQFNISQPKCGQRHTNIKVQKLGSKEEMLSRREDEEAVDKLEIDESFYLNMSNCMPEEGHFAALAKVTLEKKSNLLAIILGVVGGLLLITLLILTVVCIVTKKKKKGKMTTDSSIYIGKGNIFLPGNRQFSKTRSDNESHVYDSIDEMMVYGHLLRDSTYSDSIRDNYNGMQVDSYRTFTGPVDEQPPTIKEPDGEPELQKDYMPFLDPSESFIPSRPRTPIDRQDSLGFQDRRMVDNELYTFKNTGDINTIRLSAADLEPYDTDGEEYL